MTTYRYQRWNGFYYRDQLTREDYIRMAEEEEVDRFIRQLYAERDEKMERERKRAGREGEE